MLTVDFSPLADISILMELVKNMDKKISIQADKRWLSVKELSAYLTFGKDKIYKMVDVIFLESEHYYRKENRLLFDREKIDEWVINSSSSTSVSPQEVIDDVLTSLYK